MGGLIVNTNSTTLVVADGASVAGGNSAAITTTTSFSTLQIDGSLSGDTGILVQNGPRIFDLDPYAGAAPPSGVFVFPYIYPTGFTSIIVGPTGTIEGNVAIRLAQGPDNGLGNVLAMLDNSGAIPSIAGAAIQVSGTNKAYLSSVINRATGTIGGMDAAIVSLNNAGLVDGGSHSALAIRLTPPTFFDAGGGSVLNSGMIVSQSADATIASVNQFQSITNSGDIINNGAGPAISATGSLFVINAAQGAIISSGIAITTSGRLTLENRGQITGAILVTSSSDAVGSLIDSTSGGVIDGNVTLGAADDVILADIDDAGAISTGVRGSVDGGAGTNEVRLNVGADIRLTQPVTLPTNFQRFALNILDHATVTLASGFLSPSVVNFSGQGLLVNDTSFSANGPLFLGQGFGFSNELRFSNRANIVGTLADPSATAVKLSSTEFDNQGTISITGGSAVELVGSGINSGSIEASDTALLLTGEFENPGSLTSTGKAAILANASAQIRNLDTGVITGNGVAIARPGDGDIFTTVTISNAGTINGDVDLAGGDGRLDFGSDIFTQLAGGVVNGNVALGGGGDRFAAELRPGSDSPTGVSGTIDGGDGFDVLILRAAANGSIDLNVASNFEQTGLEVDADATLVITSGSLADQTLTVSGNGTLDLNVELSRTDGIALDATATPFLSRTPMTRRFQAVPTSSAGVPFWSHET